MEGRKLLGANVFNRKQETIKPLVTNMVVLWILGIFVSFRIFVSFLSYMLGVKKHTLFNKFLSQKKMGAVKDFSNFFVIFWIYIIY